MALVDVDLAAQLREEIRSGGEFRPRSAARPEFRHLQLVADDPEVAPEPAELDQLPADEIIVDVDPVVVTLDVPLASQLDEVSELPDYIVVPDETATDVGVVGTFLEVALDPPVDEQPVELPDYVVMAHAVVADPVSDVGVDADEEWGSNEYPVLPDLGGASEALEETDAALRKIREQLVSEEASLRRRRFRRRFTFASGLGAVVALTVLAFDVQQGVAGLPGWLGF